MRENFETNFKKSDLTVTSMDPDIAEAAFLWLIAFLTIRSVDSLTYALISFCRLYWFYS